MEKTKSELMLEEFNRRLEAGEFQKLPTWEDLEGLDPESIKYGLIRSIIDPEYEAEQLRKARAEVYSSRTISYRALHGIPPSYQGY